MTEPDAWAYLATCVNPWRHPLRTLMTWREPGYTVGGEYATGLCAGISLLEQRQLISAATADAMAIRLHAYGQARVTQDRVWYWPLTFRGMWARYRYCQAQC